MRKLPGVLLLIALALGLVSTLAASTHHVPVPTAASEAVGWFGLYGSWNEGEEPITPFLPLPEWGYCGRGKSDR
jgi:hypothetical protein